MATMGDARFGQWAQPGFGASLSQGSPASPGVLPSPDSTPTSASSAFNSPGVDPSPGQDHFQQAGLSGGSWSPGSSNDGSVFLAEGGPVPDQGQDSGNAQQPQADPFSLVQQALTYGRQKLGLPQSFFGASDTGNAPAPAAPTQSFAEGGVVEDDTGAAMDSDGDSDGDTQGASQGVIPDEAAQGQDQQAQPQQQGPDPKAAMAYLQGAGAMPAEQATALERSVDPHGTMDPNVRKMEAVKATGSPDKAFGLMQHYRQKFNAYNAFAQTAAKGSPQKPADLNASARAATQAYQHLPDGNDIRFNPVQGGMHVVIRNVVPKQAQPKKFAGGGVVDVDYETAGAKPWASDPHSIEQQGQAVADGSAESEPGAPDADPATAAYQQGQTGVLNTQYDPSQDPMGAGQSVEGEGKDSVGTAGEAARKGLQAAGGAIAKGAKAAYDSQDMGSAARKVQEFVLSIPQYLGWLAKEGQADSVLEKGADKSLAAMASSGQTMGQAQGKGPQENPPDPTEQDQPGAQGQDAQAQAQPQGQPQQGASPWQSRRPVSQQFPNPPRPQAQGQQPQNGGAPDAGGLRPTPNNAEQFGSTVGKNGGESGSSLADVLHEIDQAYPFVGMSQQRALARAAARQHWSDNRTKIEAEQTKGANMDRRATITGGFKLADTDKRVQGKHEDVATTVEGRLEGIDAQQAGAGARNEHTNATKEKISSDKEGGVESRFVRSEFGKNGRAVAMNQPSAIGNDKKMAEGIKSLGGAPQPAPNKPKGPHSAAGRSGNGPAPTSVPPPGMKYQENADKTKWRLVPAQ